MSVFVPPGKQTFIDPLTGDVVSLGTVELYIPGGSTPKDSWSDEAKTALNTNPILLDGGGQCIIWGEGLYRQIVRRADGSQLWDQVTGFSASTSSSNEVLITLQGVGSPSGGAWLGSQPFPIGVTFPVDWEGLFAWALPSGLPDTDAQFTVYRSSLSLPNGAVVGTVTLASDGSVTGNTSGLTVDFPTGSAMVVYCPDPAVSGLADFAISFLGAKD